MFDEIADDSSNFEIYPINISEDLLKSNYDGFCNDTLWPLFHYFPMYTVFDTEYFEAYKFVNNLFCETLKTNINKNDTIWVHDYQLMILPNLLRKENPHLSIGFSAYSFSGI